MFQLWAVSVCLHKKLSHLISISIWINIFIESKRSVHLVFVRSKAKKKIVFFFSKQLLMTNSRLCLFSSFYLLSHKRTHMGITLCITSCPLPKTWFFMNIHLHYAQKNYKMISNKVTIHYIDKKILTVILGTLTSSQ